MLPGRKLMALAPKTTNMVQTYVTNTQGMEKPIVVTFSPCKANLSFNKVLFHQYRKHLKNYSIALELFMIKHMIIYCNCFKVRVDIQLSQALGPELTEPIDAPNISRFHLVDMFTGITTAQHKDFIISSYAK